MTRQGHSPPRSGAGAPDAPLRSRLLALLDAGDLDAALQAGLMRYLAGDGSEDALLRAAQAQLHAAWAARERHRARSERLARQARERAARRSAAAIPATAATAIAPSPSAAGSLPPAAAAALARARAKAGGKTR